MHSYVHMNMYVRYQCMCILRYVCTVCMHVCLYIQKIMCSIHVLYDGHTCLFTLSLKILEAMVQMMALYRPQILST